MIKIINPKKNRKSSDLPREKKKLSSKLIFQVVSIFFLATVIFVLFFSGFLGITRIDISGLDKVGEEDIRNIVRDKINGKLLFTIDKNNLILIREREIKQALLGSFNRIEDVRIEKTFPDNLRIMIKERTFSMLFCASSECYVLNEKGEAYGAENFTKDELAEEKMPTLNDLGGAKINSGTNPLEDDFKDFILEIGSRVLEDTGIILRTQYETPSRMSGDLKAETEEGFRIYFNKDVGLEKEILMLSTLLNHKIERERQKDLEYIDLRIANKVFYKFKEGAEQTEEVENTLAPETAKDEKKKKKD